MEAECGPPEEHRDGRGLSGLEVWGGIHQEILVFGSKGAQVPMQF